MIVHFCGPWGCWTPRAPPVCIPQCITACLTRVLVYMKSLVNMLVHQSRFINLQRYLWDGARRRLDPVNPLGEPV